MKRIQFSNPIFFWILLLSFGGLLLWNLYATLATQKLIGLLPISIQGILITLILLRHEYAKIGIKIWSILFLVIANGLQFLGRFMQDFITDFENVDFYHYLSKGLLISVGIIIIIFTNKKVDIVVNNDSL